MSIKAVLFDLDGTLLSMDQDHFIATYLGDIAKYVCKFGYEPQSFSKALWKGTGAMVVNDGTKTNERVFWDTFGAVFPERDMKADEASFDRFYKECFDDVSRVVTRVDPDAIEAVNHIKEKGLRVILATNPLFPSIATEKRIAWAGFKVSDFEFFTSYENCSCSKPNPEYYRGVLARAGLSPEECLMVGNDVADDMVARDLGLYVFLLTDNLINKENRDISQYPNGDFKKLVEYVDSL